MKVKLKSWGEVVERAKEIGDYDDVSDTVYGLSEWAIPWGEWVDATLKGTYLFMSEDEYGEYYIKGYMIRNIPDPDELLAKGRIISSDNLHTITAEFNKRPITGDTCIRLIVYDCGLYYHKTVDGEIVDCRLVGENYE